VIRIRVSVRLFYSGTAASRIRVVGRWSWNRAIFYLPFFRFFPHLPECLLGFFHSSPPDGNGLEVVIIAHMEVVVDRILAGILRVPENIPAFRSFFDNISVISMPEAFNESRQDLLGASAVGNGFTHHFPYNVSVSWAASFGGKAFRRCCTRAW